MFLAHRAAARTTFDGPDLLSAAAERKVRINVQGKLGFECWKTIVEARRLAFDERVTLQVEVSDCDSADMAGIGALLIAIDKLGDIEVVGCTELSRYWFSNLGVCRGCRNDGSPTCPKRLKGQADDY